MPQVIIQGKCRLLTVERHMLQDSIAQSLLLGPLQMRSCSAGGKCAPVLDRLQGTTNRASVDLILTIATSPYLSDVQQHL